MTIKPGLSFPNALKSTLIPAIRTLPKATRRLSWAQDEKGDAYAVMGPYSAGFILGTGQGGMVTLDAAHGACEHLGTWAADEATGAAVAGFIRAALEAYAPDHCCGMVMAA